MKIPKILHRNNRTYKFIQKCNKNMFLYEEERTKYKVCFSRFDLGMVKEIIPAPKTDVKPENVKI